MQGHPCAEVSIMKKIKKTGIFTVAFVLLFSLCAVNVLAAPATDGLGQIKGEDLDFSERAEIALQGTVSGMLMVFAVLSLLTLVVWLSKVVFYDIPRKAKASSKTEAEASKKAEEELEAKTSQSAALTPTQQSDDSQLIAVITAAIAATIDSNPQYKSQFASGFRVVSFKRTDTKR